jgi:CheY-like chemotaxis protein
MSNILWIEDEPYYLDAHKTALEEAGYKVDFIENEVNALERLNQLPYPTLIILDIILPKDIDDPGPDNGMTTGIQLFQQIPQDVKQQVPVIVLTINAGQDTHDRLAEIGKEYKKWVIHVKPFLPSELLEEVQALMDV